MRKLTKNDRNMIYQHFVELKRYRHHCQWLYLLGQLHTLLMSKYNLKNSDRVRFFLNENFPNQTYWAQFRVFLTMKHIMCYRESRGMKQDSLVQPARYKVFSKSKDQSKVTAGPIIIEAFSWGSAIDFFIATVDPSYEMIPEHDDVICWELTTDPTEADIFEVTCQTSSYLVRDMIELEKKYTLDKRVLGTMDCWSIDPDLLKEVCSNAGI